MGEPDRSTLSPVRFMKKKVYPVYPVCQYPGLLLFHSIPPDPLFSFLAISLSVSVHSHSFNPSCRSIPSIPSTRANPLSSSSSPHSCSHAFQGLTFSLSLTTLYSLPFAALLCLALLCSALPISTSLKLSSLHLPPSPLSLSHHLKHLKRCCRLPLNRRSASLLSFLWVLIRSRTLPRPRHLPA